MLMAKTLNKKKLADRCHEFRIRNIFTHHTMLVEECLKKDVFEWGEIENVEVMFDLSELQFKHPIQWANWEHAMTLSDYELETLPESDKMFAVMHEYRDRYSTDQEAFGFWLLHQTDALWGDVYENRMSSMVSWYAISDNACYWLRQKNEVVIDNLYGYWWGRRDGGQLVESDSVIEQIVIDNWPDEVFDES